MPNTASHRDRLARYCFMVGKVHPEIGGKAMSLKLITGVRLIDGTGRDPIEHAAVLIRDTRIVAAGPQAEVLLSEVLQENADNVERWDASGWTLLPGLIDAHVHLTGDPEWRRPPDRQPPNAELIALRTARFARLSLESGFTTVRDVAALNSTIFALRQAIAEGAVAGSRIIASGNCLTIPGGHGTEFGVGMYWEINTQSEFLNAVRRQFQAGADFIKIIQTESTLFPHVPGRVYFSVDQMRPGIEEAHSVGLRVAAHANTHPEGIRNAILAGIDTLEHGYPLDDALLDLLVERQVTLIPTLAVYHQIADAVDQGILRLAPGVGPRLRQISETVVENARRAHERGVVIALGTDAGNPNTWHGDSALELILLVKAGLTPREAIVAATKRAAEAIARADQLGTVEAGKLADLILVDGNPLDQIEILRDQSRIKLVIQNGEIVVNRSSLAQLAPAPAVPAQSH